MLQVGRRFKGKTGNLQVQLRAQSESRRARKTLRDADSSICHTAAGPQIAAKRQPTSDRADSDPACPAGSDSESWGPGSLSRGAVPGALERPQTGTSEALQAMPNQGATDTTPNLGARPLAQGRSRQCAGSRPRGRSGVSESVGAQAASTHAPQLPRPTRVRPPVLNGVKPCTGAPATATKVGASGGPVGASRAAPEGEGKPPPDAGIMAVAAAASFTGSHELSTQAACLAVETLRHHRQPAPERGPGRKDCAGTRERGRACRAPYRP